MNTKAEKITFKNENEVKKWLRSFPIIKKELNLRISFYEDLAAEFSKSAEWEKEALYYKDQIAEIKRAADLCLSEYERLLDILEENEKLILTVKYLKAIAWDYIELHIYFSRRQAIRIHNNAIRKLVGQTVEVLHWKSIREA